MVLNTILAPITELPNLVNKNAERPGVVAHTFDLSAQEVKAVGSQFRASLVYVESSGQLRPHRETLSQRVEEQSNT